MKTMITFDSRIIRVSDKKAAELYHNMEAKYVSKSMWKEKVRDVNKPTEEEKPTKKKSNKMSKATKRHMRKSQ